MSDTRVNRALVLAGAVAKGAFEAGVIATLAERDLVFDRIVGTSAGALNGAVAAAGLAAGRFHQAAERIEALWKEKAAWNHIFAPVLSARGLSSTRRVRALVTDALGAFSDARPSQSVSLSLVTTDLHGTVDEGHFTYESAFSYDQAALVDRDRHAEIAEMAAASAAFPILFVPPTVKGRPRIDGGAVNNAPISYAIDAAAMRTEIYVVLAEPELRDGAGRLYEPAVPHPGPSIFGLMGQMTNIVIQERIARDLHVAQKRNRQLALLEDKLDHLELSGAQRSAVLNALGWRYLDIVPIRPLEPLEGSPFRGFISRRVREDYVQAGREAASHALDQRARQPLRRSAQFTGQLTV